MRPRKKIPGVLRVHYWVLGKVPAYR